MKSEINISRQVLQKIKQEKIAPEPKWRFLLKDYVMWAFFGISILLGGLATAVIIFLTQNSGWEIYSQGQASWLKFILLNIPYFWLLFFALFIFAAYYNFYHTNSGYRYRFFYILLISVACSIMFGSVIYGVGLGEKIENIFYKRVPFYEEIMHHRQEVWQQPGRGFLVGDLLVEDKKIILVDPMSNKWFLVFSSSSNFFSDDLIGQRVRTFGKVIEPGMFQVKMIELLRPGMGKSRMMSGRGPMPMPSNSR